MSFFNVDIDKNTFRIKAELKHCKQMHQPVMMAMQNGCPIHLSEHTHNKQGTSYKKNNNAEDNM